tara:strand:+ start:2844 stop:3311 length:468 start_codon:yes stop_codon:yes gene_type:complete
MKTFFRYIYYYGYFSKHKFWVAYYIFVFVFKLIYRAFVHDISRYRPSETKYFSSVVYVDNKKVTFGSRRYFAVIRLIKPGIDLHRFRNRHHPEFHKNGFKDMSAIDILEMMCDWKAAARRHGDGDVMKSLEINQKRYGFSDDEKEILRKIVLEIV